MNITEKLSAVSSNNVTIAENVQKVYDAGYESGDYNTGYEAGRKAEYDAFWDEYQEYGRAKQYMYCFAGYGWTDKTFKPKYDIIFNYSCIHTFQYCKITDLVKILNDCGVRLDTSNASNIYGLFGYSEVTTVPTIDASNTASTSWIFGDCKKLKTIEKFVPPKDSTIAFNTSTFQNCGELEEIRIEGTITQNGLNLRWSTKLSKASIYSIIYALAANPDPAVNNPTVTLSKAAVDKAFEMPTGANNGSTSLEWAVLSEEKGAWTKVLA
jgi:hypothetical protein